MKPKSTHTSFRYGKRLFVKLRNGQKLIKQFKETKSGVAHFMDGEKIRLRDIKSMTIYRKTI